MGRRTRRASRCRGGGRGVRRDVGGGGGGLAGSAPRSFCAGVGDGGGDSLRAPVAALARPRRRCRRLLVLRRGPPGRSRDVPALLQTTGPWFVRQPVRSRGSRPPAHSLGGISNASLALRPFSHPSPRPPVRPRCPRGLLEVNYSSTSPSPLVARNSRSPLSPDLSFFSSRVLRLLFIKIILLGTYLRSLTSSRCRTLTLYLLIPFI